MIEVYFWLTDNGYKSLIGIEETGLPHVKKPVALPKREQFNPEYLKISPGHKIPAIVDTEGPGGKRISLCESGALLKYLAEKAGGALYPADPAKRIPVDQWFFWGTSTFTPLAQQYGLFMHRFGQDVPPAKKHYTETLRDMFATLDRHFAEHEYLAGDYSVADISCYPDVHGHGKEGMGLGDWPNLERWHDRVAARPAVQRAYATKV